MLSMDSSKEANHPAIKRQGLNCRIRCLWHARPVIEGRFTFSGKSGDGRFGESAIGVRKSSQTFDYGERSGVLSSSRRSRNQKVGRAVQPAVRAMRFQAAKNLRENDRF